MELKIELNTANGGRCCFFEHDGHEFFADLCHTFDYGTECMIFSSKDKQVTNWLELYCKRDIRICDESLRACVEEFIRDYDNHQ